MSKVNGGGGPIDPPPLKASCDYFSRRLLGLSLLPSYVLLVRYLWLKSTSRKVDNLLCEIMASVNSRSAVVSGKKSCKCLPFFNVYCCHRVCILYANTNIIIIVT